MKINNLFRWTGSKRKLLDAMLEVFDDKDTYIEPFLGSGIVLLRVLAKKQYKTVYVNDVNKNVIDFYTLLKDEGDELIREIKARKKKYDKLGSLEEKEKFFYTIREKFNRNKYRVDYKNNLLKTVDFWFLMQAGYNGVYRVNTKGYFNVPFGKKEHLIFSEESFYEAQTLLNKSGVEIHFFNLDYLEFLELLEEENKLTNSYMYCDPPYLPDTESMAGPKTLYTSINFSHDEFSQVILSLSNKYDFNFSISATENSSSEEIYSNIFFEKQNILEIIRSVNPKRKLKVREVLFKKR